MKSLFLSLIAVVVLTSMQQKPLKVIFFGDSITQQGAAPGGYIPLAADLLKEKGLASNYELSGAGIGGNEVGGRGQRNRGSGGASHPAKAQRGSARTLLRNGWKLS